MAIGNIGLAETGYDKTILPFTFLWTTLITPWRNPQAGHRGPAMDRLIDALRAAASGPVSRREDMV
jgi:hypothetical protein